MLDLTKIRDIENTLVGVAERLAESKMPLDDVRISAHVEDFSLRAQVREPHSNQRHLLMTISFTNRIHF